MNALPCTKSITRWAPATSSATNLLQLWMHSRMSQGLRTLQSMTKRVLFCGLVRFTIAGGSDLRRYSSTMPFSPLISIPTSRLRLNNSNASRLNDRCAPQTGVWASGFRVHVGPVSFWIQQRVGSGAVTRIESAFLQWMGPLKWIEDNGTHSTRN